MKQTRAARNLLLGACLFSQANPTWVQQDLGHAIESIDPKIEAGKAKIRVLLDKNTIATCELGMGVSNDVLGVKCLVKGAAFSDLDLDGRVDKEAPEDQKLYSELLSGLMAVDEFKRIPPGSICGADAEQKPESLRSTLAATARIHHMDYPDAICSAYYVASGLWVTAAHCYTTLNPNGPHPRGSKFWVEWPKIDEKTGGISGVYGAMAEGIFMDQSDTGLLGMDIHTKNLPEPLSFSNGEQMEKPYALVGNPYDTSWVIAGAPDMKRLTYSRSGYVMSAFGLSPEEECLAGPGDSGGPMLANGLVVGTTVRFQDVVSNQNGVEDRIFLRVLAERVLQETRDFLFGVDAYRYLQPMTHLDPKRGQSEACDVENKGILVDISHRKIYQHAWPVDCRTELPYSHEELQSISTSYSDQYLPKIQESKRH